MQNFSKIQKEGQKNILFISANNITKYFEKTKALNSLSFNVNKGELFGFIGPDGAGKTTLLRIITTLLIPDEGNIHVLKYNTVKDYKAIRKITGYMPGKFSLYQDLSVIENLTFFAQVFGTTIEENYFMIKDIYSQLEPFKHRKAKNLSGGMKQKLALSCALIHNPELLVLDEPTTGVDAVSRKEFWQLLRLLQQKNITILVSTPYMDEATLCDRVALMQNGNILSINTPAAIIDDFEPPIYSVYSNKIFQLIKDLRQYPDAKSVFAAGKNLHLTLKQALKNEDTIINYIKNKGHENIQLKKIKPDIEDCFMDLMQTT